MRLVTAGSCSSVSSEEPLYCITHQPLISLVLVAGIGVVGFCICTIPKLHYHVMLVSTGFVGATAVMLGIDCFTTAGLKEVMHVLDASDEYQFLLWLHSSTCGTLVSCHFSPSTRVTVSSSLSRK